MTHMSLQECSQHSLQELHRIAHANDWGEIKHDTRDAMTRRQMNGESWSEL